MNLKTRYAHESNYTKGRNKRIQYIVIHYTANDGDTSAGNANYFSQPNRNASAHYFVDENTVTQTVKDTDTAWHCGTRGAYFHPYCRNSNSIGIELCSEKNRQTGANQYYFNEPTIQNAVELVQILMEKYSIPIENIVRHYDVTHKICPEPFVSVPKAWNGFLKKIQKEEEMEVEKRYNTMEEVPEWGKSTIQKLIEKGSFADSKKLDLSEDMLRIFVINDRAGLYK